MKTKTPFLCCALLAAALSCGTAMAADNTNTATTSTARSSSNLKDADVNFLQRAAKSGMKEVAVSQAALPNLKNAQVRSFAEMMVADHSGSNSELMALASRKGVTLAEKELKVDNKFSKASDDLDEEYMETMVKDHKEAVELFEKASKSADSEIAAFAQKTLPTLRAHLEQAEQLKKMVD
jgi:putative membrane protein